MSSLNYTAVLFISVLATSSALAADSSSNLQPDNSGKNIRDRQTQAMTADRQWEGSKSDVDITREIRRAVTKDDSLSIAAKNVKIITKHGAVVLRGPVATALESKKIAEIAKNNAGVTQVQNDLEVKN